MSSKPIVLFIYKLINSGIRIWAEAGDLHVIPPKDLRLSSFQLTFIKKNKNNILKVLEKNKITSRNDKFQILSADLKKFPLSFAQERLWFIHKYEKGTNAYNVPLIFKLSKDINLKALEKSIHWIVTHHKILRTVLREDKAGNGYQLLLSEETSPFQIQYPKVEYSKVENYFHKEINHVFNLSDEHPTRVTFLETLDTKEYFLSIVIHHVAFDGWSFDIFLKELEVSYSYYAGLKANQPEEPLIQYRDFALWQRQDLNRKRLQKEFSYWRQKLSGLETLSLPTDYSRQKKIDYSGADVYFTLDESLSNQLRTLAQKLNVSLFSLLLSGYYLMLRAYSHQDDIVVGSPVANRHYSDSQDMIGFFVNSLVLRTVIDSATSLKNYIQKVGNEIIAAQLNQDLPFEKIVEELDLIKDTSRHPLFQVMFTVQSFDDRQTHISDKCLQKIMEPYKTSHNLYNVAYFDLTTFIDDSQVELQGRFNYATSLYNEETIERYIKTYKLILSQFVAAVYKLEHVKVAEINYVDKSEFEQVIYQWNETDKEWPSERTLHQLFENQVDKTPDKIAILFKENKISYRELNEKANQLAHFLIKNYRLKSNHFIGLCLDRTENMIISILAILKSGSAYVPIDPTYPDERIKYILNDTKPVVVICEPHYYERLSNLSALNATIINNHQLFNLISAQNLINPNVKSSSSNLAYIMYTSGTSGQPKGVMVQHGGIINLIYSLIEKYRLGENGTDEGILQFANYVFDVSCKQIFLALLNGFRLVLLPEKLWLNREVFYSYLESHDVTHIGATPSFLEQYDFSHVKTTKRIAFGGESINQEFYYKMNRGVGDNLYNIYGATEASITSTFNHVKEDNLHLGFPISNVQCYVLNVDLMPVPVGAIGEIFIGGHGIARGYLNQPALTSSKFIANPFQTMYERKQGKNQRLYKTGDLARRLEDGNLAFIGRNDSQIKINGHRIELAEIEQSLLAHDGIQKCVVLVKREPHMASTLEMSCLVSYYVSESEIDQESLAEYLSQKLPDYMIPQKFVWVPEFPLTSNGKLDTRALPNPQVSIDRHRENPQSATEIKLCKIWSDILKIDSQSISLQDSFFKIGGNSILAIKLANRINAAFNGHAIDLSVIFQHKTLKKIAYCIDLQRNEDIVIPKYNFLKKQEQTLSFPQERLWFIQQFKENSTAYNIPMIFKIVADVNLGILRTALNAIIFRHEILKTVIQEASDGQAYQVLLDEKKSPFRIKHKQLRNEAALKQELIADAIIPFDLSKDYPLRISLYEITENEERYINIICHHIAFDGWSTEIFLRDLQAFYDYYSFKNKDLNLPELPIQYKDFAVWQKSYLNKEKLEKLLSYCLKKLENYEPLNIICDKPRPNTFDEHGNTILIELDAEITHKLKELTKELNISLHNFLLGSYCLLLKAYTNQEDILIGIPLANRQHNQVQNLIGFFVNTLPVRIKVSAQLSLKSFFERVEEEVIDVQSYQDLPFEKLVDALNLPKDSSRHPLFQNIFTVNSFNASIDNETPILLPLAEDCENVCHQNVAKIDMSTFVDIDADKFKVGCNYAVSLFETSTIHAFLETYQQILSQLASFAGKKERLFEIRNSDINFCKKNIPIINANKSDLKIPTDKTINDLFEEQVQKTPSRIALIDNETTLTYTELNEKANKVANYLRKNFSLKPDLLVVVCLDRSIDMIISILGILKAGVAYVPIDPNAPAPRINYILENTNTPLVISSIKYCNYLKEFNKSAVLSIDCPAFLRELTKQSKENIRSNTTSKNLAYVIYTSGTTGEPKGVMVEHASIVNLKYNLTHKYKINEPNNEEVILQSSNYTFDPSVEQLVLSLLNGQKLLLMPENLWLDEIAFYDFLNSHKVTHINAPPTLLKQYDFNKVPSLKRLIFGGEILTNDCFAQDTSFQIFNVYGPTETTIIATLNSVSGDNLSIGVPLINVECYILDNLLRSVPQGAVGELYIGGIGVARGYLNDPCLTSEKFIASPFKKDARLYKTGDQVRVRPDGNIEYICRNDDQIKLRGYRIELTEIETVLSSFPGVLQGIVALKSHSQENTNSQNVSTFLVGYYVSDKPINNDELFKFVSSKLPEYMVPTQFLRLTALPMNNGKLDRKSLPVPDFSEVSSRQGPRNKTELALAKIWALILKLDVESISINESFFRLGGNSILAIRLTSLINTHFHLRLRISDIFIHKTIASQALIISPLNKKYKPLVSFGGPERAANLFMIHPGSAGCEVYLPLANQLASTFKCYGIDSYNLYHKNKIDNLGELTAFYLKCIEAKMALSDQTSFHLLGWSFGGQIALQLAAMLEKKGCRNIYVYLLDYILFDDKISTFKEKIDFADFKSHYKNELMKKGYQSNYVDKVIEVFEVENELSKQGLAITLDHSKLLLFKAMQKNKNFSTREYQDLSSYILSLTYNNLEKVTKNLKLIQIKNACHDNLLSQGKFISKMIIENYSNNI